jgi:hypothetical protein
LFALAVRMSWPAGGVFAVTIGSTFGSKNIGVSRAINCSGVSPPRTGKAAPACAAARTAAVSASGVQVRTNLRAVRLL